MLWRFRKPLAMHPWNPMLQMLLCGLAYDTQGAHWQARSVGRTTVQIARFICGLIVFPYETFFDAVRLPMNRSSSLSAPNMSSNDMSSGNSTSSSSIAAASNFAAVCSRHS